MSWIWLRYSPLLANRNMMMFAFLYLVVFPRSTLAYSGRNPNKHPVKVLSSKTFSLPNTLDTTKAETVGKIEHAKHPREKQGVSSIALRKKWGVDNEHLEEYWFDHRIHTLGNAGLTGALHAALAPISTRMIDKLAYNNVDIRRQLAEELYCKVGNSKARVLDMCCGVGFSTRALRKAFPDAERVVGIDTSHEMIAMADFITDHINHLRPFFGLTKYVDRFSNSVKSMKRKGYAVRKSTMFSLRNAEDTKLPTKSFDLVTIMYAFHEAPSKGRNAILNEAHRLLVPGGTLAVVDISTDYTPSSSMLMGEPYIQEYQANISHELQCLRGFQDATYQTVVPNHLGMWTLQKLS